MFLDSAFDTIYSANDNNDDGTFDVVVDHQHCYCKLKPSSADHLHHSAVHHKSWPRQITELGEEVDEDKIVPNSEEEVGNISPDNEDLQSDASELPRKCAKCNSTHHDAKLTQLCFYKGAWVDILEHVKQFFQLWLVKNCPFTTCEANLPDTQNTLNKAIEEFQAKDVEVGAGEYGRLSLTIA